MKKRVLAILLCIAAVSILPACNDQKDNEEPFDCKTAYNNTLDDLYKLISSPAGEEMVYDGMYGVYH